MATAATAATVATRRSDVMATGAGPPRTGGSLGAVLRHVHGAGPTSRADLTAALGLNRSTIGDLTGRLEALGLVREQLPDEAGRAGRRTGRPSHVVVPRRDVAVLTVVLDIDRVTVALVGLGGVVLERCTRSHRPGEQAVEQVADAVARQCREVLALDAQTRCVGVGVSVPGLVRRSDGLVRVAPNLGWEDVAFPELLARRLQRPLVADNDGSLSVVAEHLRGAAVGFDDVAYITGSVGIGGGFVVDGRLVRGHAGQAGEVGHLLVDSNGVPCRCGAVGCWETKVGEDRLLTGAGRPRGGGRVAVAEVLAAAQDGEPRAAGAVADVASWTGVGLSNVVMLFDPRVIVLGGLLGQVWKARPDLVQQGIEEASRLARRDSLLVRSASLGEDSALLGAAEAAFAALLADPHLITDIDDLAAAPA